MLETMLSESGFYYLALDAISQLAMFGVLGPIVNQDLSSFVDGFKDIIRAKVKKIDERSVIAFGYLTLTGKTGLDSESLSDDEQVIFNTHVSKQVEYLFYFWRSTCCRCCWLELKIIKQTVGHSRCNCRVYSP